MNKQKILLLILTVTILSGAVSYNIYQSIYGGFITKDCSIFIRSFDTMDDIQKTLSKALIRNKILKPMKSLNFFGWQIRKISQNQRQENII